MWVLSAMAFYWAGRTQSDAWLAGAIVYGMVTFASLFEGQTLR